MCAILMPYRLTDSNITSYTKLNTRDIYSQYAQLTSDIIRKHLATIITRGYNLLDIIASCLLPSCYLPSFNKYKQGRRITSSNITNITNQQTRATSLDCLIAISKIINPVNPLTAVTFIPRIGAYGACDSNAAILSLIPLIQQPSQNTINIACEIADSVCVDDNCNSCDIKIAILASAAILCDDIKTFNAINTHYANELKTGTPKLVKLL
jgi:hypothetical protein